MNDLAAAAPKSFLDEMDRPALTIMPPAPESLQANPDYLLVHRNDWIRIETLARELIAALTKAYKESPNRDAIGCPSKIDEILSACAEAFGVSIDALTSNLRTHEVAWARQTAMVLCREITKMGTRAIGKVFFKDHSLVCYAAKEVEFRRAHDPEYRAIYDALKARLTGEAAP